MPDSARQPPANNALDRSPLFQLFRDLIQRVYSPSLEEAYKTHGLVLVGGQALTLWARHYLLDEMTGEEIGFVTSDDLDFIGRQSSIRYCEETLSIAFQRAKMEDSTPNLAAAVLLWDDDKPIIIDILDAIAGVSLDEIIKNLEVLDLDGVKIAIIDPVACLKSRLFNLFAPWTNDRNREHIRIKLACRAAQAYLFELLGDPEEGYPAIRGQLKMIRDMALSRYGLQAFVEYGIDLTSAVPLDPYTMPQAFLQQEWPRFTQQLATRRQVRLDEYRRRGRDSHPMHDTPVAPPYDPR